MRNTWLEGMGQIYHPLRGEKLLDTRESWLVRVYGSNQAHASGAQSGQGHDFLEAHSWLLNARLYKKRTRLNNNQQNPSGLLLVRGFGVGRRTVITSFLPRVAAGVQSISMRVLLARLRRRDRVDLMN